jgi:hypothetical protein
MGSHTHPWTSYKFCTACADRWPESTPPSRGLVHALSKPTRLPSGSRRALTEPAGRLDGTLHPPLPERPATGRPSRCRYARTPVRRDGSAPPRDDRGLSSSERAEARSVGVVVRVRPGGDAAHPQRVRANPRSRFVAEVTQPRCLQTGGPPWPETRPLHRLLPFRHSSALAHCPCAGS